MALGWVILLATNDAGGEPRLPGLVLLVAGRRGVHRRRGAVRHRLEEEVFPLHFPLLLSDMARCCTSSPSTSTSTSCKGAHDASGRFFLRAKKQRCIPCWHSRLRPWQRIRSRFRRWRTHPRCCMKRCRISTGRASTLPAVICCILATFQAGRPARRFRSAAAFAASAAATRQVQVVPDVQRFPGHIACDSASRSEIVLPIWVDGRLLGVLDIDSPSLNRFTEEDADGLTAFVAALTRSVDFAHGLLK